MKKTILFFITFLACFSFSCKYDVDTDDYTENTTKTTTTDDTSDTKETETDDTSDTKETETETTEETKPIVTPIVETKYAYVKYYYNSKLLYTEKIDITDTKVKHYAEYGIDFVPTVDDFKEFDSWCILNNDEYEEFDFENYNITSNINLYAKDKDIVYNFIHYANGNSSTQIKYQFTLDEIEDYITENYDKYFKAEYFLPYSNYVLVEDCDFDYTNYSNGAKIHSDIDITMLNYKNYITKNDMTYDTLYFYTIPQLKKYTLTWDLNGGEWTNSTSPMTEISPTYCNIDTSWYSNVIKPSDDVYDYTFLGWYDENGNKVTVIDRSNYMNYKNKTIHAEFSSTKIYAHAYFYDEEGQLFYNTNVKKGESLSEVNYENTYETREFLGWYDENDNLYDFTQIVTEDDDIVLHAKFDVFSIITLFGKTYKFEYLDSSRLINDNIGGVDKYVQVLPFGDVYLIDYVDEDGTPQICTWRSDCLIIDYDYGENKGSKYHNADDFWVLSANLRKYVNNGEYTDCGYPTKIIEETQEATVKINSKTFKANVITFTVEWMNVTYGIKESYTNGTWGGKVMMFLNQHFNISPIEELN